MYAVDVQADGRIIHVLRDIDFAHAGKFSNVAGQILRDVIGRWQDRVC